ncbi:MAG: hypothetical protein MPL62_10220 [Alphaproteobacteria bacterium]|nr:hypothetical protein [Alphaproteobacteria bacterium]
MPAQSLAAEFGGRAGLEELRERTGLPVISGGGGHRVSRRLKATALSSSIQTLTATVTETITAPLLSSSLSLLTGTVTVTAAVLPLLSLLTGTVTVTITAPLLSSSSLSSLTWTLTAAVLLSLLSSLSLSLLTRTLTAAVSLFQPALARDCSAACMRSRMRSS